MHSEGRVGTDMESTAGSEITGELGSPSPSLQQCWSVVVGLAADRSRLSAADAGQSTCCSCSDISQLRAEQPAALSSQTPHCSCSALHSLSHPPRIIIASKQGDQHSYSPNTTALVALDN